MNESTESQLIEAAIKVIIERGYVGATTKRIADEAGVNEVTLFRRFGSKAQLLLTALRQEFEHFKTKGIHYSGDLEADLVRVATTYADLIKRRGRIIPVMMAEVPRRPELRGGLELPLQIVSTIADLIARYQAEGKLIHEPPLQATLTLLGPVMLSGLARHISLFTVELEPHEHVRRFLDGRRQARNRP